MAAIELGTGYVSVGGDTRQLSADIGAAFTKANKQAGAAGTSAGSSFGSTFSKGLKVAGVAGVAGAGLIMATAFTKGFSRLNAIDQARAKLRGLSGDMKLSAKEIEGVMESANKAVKGTAFGLDEAATAASGAMAAGVKQGKDLESYLSTIADTATVAGTSMTEMGSIFNKVATSNKVQADVFNQLGDRGVAVVQMLAKELNVSGEEVYKLASKGKIDFATFRKAMEAGVGGAAAESGKTFSGALKNMNAALGRFGAKLLEPIFNKGPAVFGAITSGIDKVTKSVGPFVSNLGKSFSEAFSGISFDSVKSLLSGLGSTFAGLGSNLLTFGQNIMPIIISAFNFLAPIVMNVAGVVGTILVGAFRIAVGAITAIVGVIANVTRFFNDHRGVLIAVGAVIGTILLPYLTVLAVGFTAVAVAAVKSGAMQALAWLKSSAGAIRAGVVTLIQSAKIVGAWVLMGAKAVANAAMTAGAWLSSSAGAALASARTLAYAAAQGVVRGATIAWTGVQWLLNAALSANPLALVVIAIVAFIAAIVIAYNKSETFRNIVTAAWNGIKAAMSAVWGWISGTLWPGIKAVFAGIGNVAMWLWNNVISPAFAGIKFAISLAWAYIQFVFQVWQTVFKIAGAVVMWLWNNAIVPAFNGIGSIIGAVWNGIIKPVWDAFKTAIQIVGDAAMWLWNNAMVPAWNGIKSAISTVWDFLKPVFEKLGTAINTIGEIGKKVGQTMKSAFDGVVNILKAPIHAVGKLLSAIPTSILGVDIPGASTIKSWGQTMQSLRSGGFINAAPGGFIVRASESRKHRGLLAAMGGQRISGPGTGTSDSIPAFHNGRQIANVSNGETYFTPGLAAAYGETLGAINGGFGFRGPGYAGGGVLEPWSGGGGEENLKPIAVMVRRLIHKFWPEITDIGGYRASDPYPDHPSGQALDIMNSDVPRGDAIKTWLMDNKGIFSLDYTIWRQKYEPASGGGNMMEDRGNATQNHMDHIHALFGKIGSPPAVNPDVIPEGLKSPAGKAPLEGEIQLQAGPVEDTTTGVGGEVAGEKKEPFSSVKTTRELFGKWGQITGESLFDIFMPSAFSEVDPVALADRYMLRGDEEQSSTTTPGEATAQTPTEKAEQEAQERKLKDDFDEGKKARRRKYEDDSAALSKKYRNKELTRDEYDKQKLELKRAYEDDNDSARKTYEDSRLKLREKSAPAGEAPVPAPEDPTKPTNAPGRDNYIKDTVAAVKSMSLPLDAAIIAVGTELVETGIKMYANNAVPESLKFPHDAVGSDHDSVGLYQQRQAGWGTLAQRMSAFESTKLFLNAMTQKFPNWQNMEKGAVAQGVQVSAYPDRYAGKMDEARQLLIGKFDRGGLVPPGVSLVENRLRRYEQAAVFTPSQWETLQELPEAGGGSIDARVIIERLVVEDWRQAQRELKSLGQRQQMRYSRSHTK